MLEILFGFSVCSASDTVVRFVLILLVLRSNNEKNAMLMCNGIHYIMLSTSRASYIFYFHFLSHYCSTSDRVRLSYDKSVPLSLSNWLLRRSARSPYVFYSNIYKNTTSTFDRPLPIFAIYGRSPGYSYCVSMNKGARNCQRILQQQWSSTAIFEIPQTAF